MCVSHPDPFVENVCTTIHVVPSLVDWVVAHERSPQTNFYRTNTQFIQPEM